MPMPRIDWRHNFVVRNQLVTFYMGALNEYEKGEHYGVLSSVVYRYYVANRVCTTSIILIQNAHNDR